VPTAIVAQTMVMKSPTFVVMNPSRRKRKGSTEAPSHGTLGRMTLSNARMLDQFRDVLLALSAVAVACGSLACRATSSTPAAAAVSPDTWAVVDGRTITRNDVEKAYRRAHDATQTLSDEEALTAKLGILNDLIVQDILLAKATALKLAVAQSDVDTAYA